MSWPQRIAFGLGSILMVFALLAFTFGNLSFGDAPLWWFVAVGWGSWLALSWLMWRHRKRSWLVLSVPLVWSVAISALALQVCGMTGAAGVGVACIA